MRFLHESEHVAFVENIYLYPFSIPYRVLYYGMLERALHNAERRMP